jgi:hypothetical protein
MCEGALSRTVLKYFNRIDPALPRELCSRTLGDLEVK